MHLLWFLLPCLFGLQHFFHIIDKIMVPPCGKEDECNKRFLVNPDASEGK
jgi:hypothetical protein